jgi:hypothetical protein
MEGNVTETRKSNVTLLEDTKHLSKVFERFAILGDERTIRGL